MKPRLEFDGKVEFTLTANSPKVSGLIVIDEKIYPFIASSCKASLDDRLMELGGLYFSEPCLDSHCELKLLGPFTLKLKADIGIG